ncbi:MAG TPA: RICIN domain-containing protein [Allosphingosinicella sp.]|jgi:hypothetical protein
MNTRAYAISRAALAVAAAMAASLSLGGEARAQFTGPGVYVITSASSRKVLDLDNSWWRDGVAGMPLIQWDPHGGTNQRFRIVADVGGSFTIRPLHSGQCLEVRPATGADGADIQQSPCRPAGGNAAQRFLIGPVLFLQRLNYIQPAGSRTALSTRSPSGGDAHHNGARILLSAYSLDHWRLVNTQFQFTRIGP